MMSHLRIDTSDNILDKVDIDFNEITTTDIQIDTLNINDKMQNKYLMFMNRYKSIEKKRITSTSNDIKQS